MTRRPNREHDHEWEPTENSYPVLEDGAAIFIEECRWAPILNSYSGGEFEDTYYEEGEPCGEERSLRFELQRIGHTDGAPSMPVDDPYDFREVVNRIEEAYRDDEEDVEFRDVDPHEEHGRVVVQVDSYIAYYEP